MSLFEKSAKLNFREERSHLILKRSTIYPVWWLMLVITTFEKLRQEDHGSLRPIRVTQWSSKSGLHQAVSLRVNSCSCLYLKNEFKKEKVTGTPKL